MRSGLRAEVVTLMGVAMCVAGCGGARGHLDGPHVPHRPPDISAAQPDAGTPDGEALPSLAFAHRIDDQRTFDALAVRPESEPFARTQVARFLIDLQDGENLWFPDAHRWPIHYDFARHFLADHIPVEDHAAFNIREYRRPDRRFILGSIVHYVDSDLWTLELIAGDDLDGERLVHAFEKIRAATFFGAVLKYRPLSELHEQRIAGVRDRLPLIATEAVFGAQRYQPLTLGTAFGVLRLVRGALDEGALSPNEIVVTRDVPDDIPLVSALVTSTLQAPLAHVAVLSQNRGSPNAAVRGAVDDARFTALEGHLVRLTIGPQDFALSEATREDAERSWQGRRPPQAFVPALDLTEHRLRDLGALRERDVATAGAKASQLGEVAAMGGSLHTPGGFAIPMAAYADHLHRTALDARRDQLLADPAFRRDRAVRDRQLHDLRDAIARAPIDPTLLRQVSALVRRFPRTGRVIFRSSTNAEDLAGFNGAGLYESLVVPPSPTDAQISDAIRGVWASVFTLRGVDERDWYRIDEAHVAMAILVMPYVEHAIGNGVAITKNPFNEGRPAVFINVQSHGGSVTSAGDAVPEQHLVYTYGETLEDEIVSRSSLTNGAAILPEDDVTRLTQQLMALHARLVPTYGDRANAVDVEFLIDEHHDVIVVQARPYKVTYTEGQRWILLY